MQLLAVQRVFGLQPPVTRGAGKALRIFAWALFKAARAISATIRHWAGPCTYTYY
jgi:hypothetical protein